MSQNNKTSRLITFGCSLTYGQGLPDCVNKKDYMRQGPLPSNLGWASLLAKDLKMDVINKGNPGASNLEILNEILKFDYRNDDTVVVMWTYSFRDTYFYKKLLGGYSFKQLARWVSTIGHILWSPNGDEVDYAIKTWLYIHHADLFFKHKKLKYLHYPADVSNFEKHKPHYINISNFYSTGFVFVDKGLDNSHPGVLSNIKTSKTIYEILNDKK